MEHIWLSAIFVYFWIGAFITGVVTVVILLNDGFKWISKSIKVVLLVWFLILWPIGIVVVYLSNRGGNDEEGAREDAESTKTKGVRIGGIITHKDGKVQLIKFH